MERNQEIADFARHFIVEHFVDKEPETIGLMITAFQYGARWADKYPENAFEKPSALNFYNAVMIMRANQRNFFELNNKKDRTPEEEESRKKYLSNSKEFEKRVDEIIAKAQEIMKRQNNQ